MEDPWKAWKRQREAAVAQKENLKERVKIEEPEEVTEFVEESKEDLRKRLRLADNEGEMAPMGIRRYPIAPQNEANQGKPARGRPEEPIGSKNSLLDGGAFRQWVMERGRGKRNAKPSLLERKTLFDCFLRAAESLTPPFNGIHLLLQFKRLYNIEEIHRHFGYHKVAEFIQSFPEFFDQGDGYFKFRTQEDDSIVKERILNVAHQLPRPFKESQFCGLYKQIYGDRDAFRTLGCKSLAKALMTSKFLDRVRRSKNFYLRSGYNQQSAVILKGERMVQPKKAKQNSRIPKKIAVPPIVADESSFVATLPAKAPLHSSEATAEPEKETEGRPANENPPAELPFLAPAHPPIAVSSVPPDKVTATGGGFWTRPPTCPPKPVRVEPPPTLQLPKHSFFIRSVRR